MIRRAAILMITTEQQLSTEFESFEGELEIMLKPLREKLEQSVIGASNNQLLAHMAYVESWRDRVGRFFSLATTFLEHAKSSLMLLQRTVDGTKLTGVERDAYRRKLAAGFAGIVVDLEGMIDSIDSRVNLCKKLMDFEVRGLNPRG